MAGHPGIERSYKPQQSKHSSSNPGNSESADHPVLELGSYLITECLETYLSLLSKGRRRKLCELSQINRLRLDLAGIRITTRTLQPFDDGLMEPRRYGGVIPHNLNRICSSLLDVSLDLTYKQTNQYSHSQHKTNLAEGIEHSTAHAQFSARHFRKRHIREALETQSHPGADDNSTPGRIQEC